MTDTALTHDTVEIQPHIPPERVAWSVLLLSFGVFCILCAGITIGLQYFFFQSSIPMGVILQVGRNTARIIQNNGTEQAEINQREIGAGVIVVTDENEIRAQSNLVFSSTTSDDIIALVTLKGGTSVEVARAVRPRFSWSTTDYSIHLTDVVGQLDIRVSDNLSRQLDFNITTINNTEIRLQPGGHYELTVDENKVELKTVKENAIVITPGRTAASSVPEGYIEQFNVTTGEFTRSEPTFVNLVQNSDLTADITDDGTVEIAHWTCENRSDDNGTFGQIVAKNSPQGLPSLELVRSGSLGVSGATECIQEFTETQYGVDVRDYNYLSVRVTLFVQYQSLSRCGTLATECPLMLRLNFFPEDGVERRWIHGIYARNDPASDYPVWCDSCREAHVSIYSGSTYIYESSNLFSLFPGAEAPEYLSELYFYASGHEYDVYVTDIAIYAAHIEPDDTSEPITMGELTPGANG